MTPAAAASRPPGAPQPGDGAPALNRLLLSAELVERSALRYTPAGLPALDFRLQHESTVTQDGTPRSVSFEIRARAIGAITPRIERLAVGSRCGFAGFLGAQRNGRGTVFHVTEVDPEPPAPLTPLTPLTPSKPSGAAR